VTVHNDELQVYEKVVPLLYMRFRVIDCNFKSWLFMLLVLEFFRS
jgi:hypothetical protein